MSNQIDSYLTGSNNSISIFTKTLMNLGILSSTPGALYTAGTSEGLQVQQTALESKLAEYFNSDTNTIDEKLYLAKVMHLQQGGLEFEIDTILKSINNDITKELARYIFTGENATLFETKESYNTKGIIVTSNEDEIITTSDAGNKILLNGGDDKLILGKDSLRHVEMNNRDFSIQREAI